MFNSEFSNWIDVAQQLGFQMDYIDYDMTIEKEKDERNRNSGKTPKLLALMAPPVQSLPPSINGSYSAVFDEAVKTYRIKDDSSGDFRWYPKHGMKPSIDVSATGIVILTDSDGDIMIAADLFGAGAIVCEIGWLLGV